MMEKLRLIGVSVGLIACLLLVGCLATRVSGTIEEAVETPTATPYATSTPEPSASTGGWIDWDGKGGWTGPLEIEKEVAKVVEKEGVVSDQGQSPLRAGEVDDNANWDDYLLYRVNYAGPFVHDRDVSERYVVSVRDTQERPLLDASVTFYANDEPVFSGRTYATGQTLFFPKALGVSDDITLFQVVVKKDDVQKEATLIRGEIYELTVNLVHPGRAPEKPVHLDVFFLIDSTGSMADEIDKLQESIQEIAARIDQLPSQPRVRFGMTIYRDRGELFVSRTFDFTPDVSYFSDALAKVKAQGGGDYPESLNEALHRAIHAPEWRVADTVQLMFLVADAPPHLDYAQDYDYAVEMVKAAERGIKIFPIATSGLDDQAEYIFRQIAVFTQGRFIFLTYGLGGEPGDSTTHHVEDYTVQHLDELVVRLVEEELAHQQ